MRSDYIKPSIYTQVYQLMVYENALVLRTSLETGLRISDVLNLQKNDLKGNTIHFTAQKTGKKGKKVISSDLSKRLRQVCGKKWFFTGRFGSKPRTRQAVWKDLKKCAKEMHIKENLTCHSARKTYAVEDFHNKGLPHTQKELQHDRVETTMLYAYSDLLVGKGQNKINDSTELYERLDRIEKKIDEILSRT